MKDNECTVIQTVGGGAKRKRFLVEDLDCVLHSFYKAPKNINDGAVVFGHADYGLIYLTISDIERMGLMGLFDLFINSCNTNEVFGCPTSSMKRIPEDFVLKNYSLNQEDTRTPLIRIISPRGDIKKGIVKKRSGGNNRKVNKRKKRIKQRRR